MLFIVTLCPAATIKNDIHRYVFLDKIFPVGIICGLRNAVRLLFKSNKYRLLSVYKNRPESNPRRSTFNILLLCCYLGLLYTVVLQCICCFTFSILFYFFFSGVDSAVTTVRISVAPGNTRSIYFEHE